ncbi:hypothetical protein [Streptomyces sp. NBC_01198]|uniref:hypothetical protein n=1 Tax=Streptomyces sp. NBC_01198 TaxID=2903769 RepID=UPI002E1278ED|nr:hypothetical protein OG702_32180 [Streptomyces sp. NBC_01198]
MRNATFQCVEYVAVSDGITIPEAAEWMRQQPEVVRGLATSLIEDPDPTDGGPIPAHWLDIAEDWVLSLLGRVQRGETVVR